MQPYQKWIFSGLLTASASCFAAQPSSQNMNDSKSPPVGQITPPAGPRTDTGARFLVTADFIYWQAEEDNLLYDEYSANSSSGETQTTVKKPAKLDFEYAPGFKVGAGALFDHDNWDIFANYTWLKQEHAKGRVSYPNLGSDLRTGNPFGHGGASSLTLTTTHAHWTCHFNNIDLELGRQFFISRDLVLRPHFGLKGSWMAQEFNILQVTDYPDGVGGGTLLPFVQTSQTRHNQDFWGIGLRAGLNTAWHFTHDWSIYGDIAASELACRFNDRKKVADTFTTTDFQNITLLNKSFSIVRPVLEIALGVRYETFFSRDRYQFFVQAGWEQQIWWDQNQFLNQNAQYIDTGSGGALTLQGLDVKLGFAF